VENAPLGIKSAKTAGMKTFAITSTLPKDYLTEADIIVDSISVIARLLDL
jgi:beta-phosphoglucomutase